MAGGRPAASSASSRRAAIAEGRGDARRTYTINAPVEIGRSGGRKLCQRKAEGKLAGSAKRGMVYT
jgi:hypothetical protein